MKSGDVKLVLWSQTYPFGEMMWSCKCFLHVSKMPTVTYTRANNAVIQNAREHYVYVTEKLSYTRANNVVMQNAREHYVYVTEKLSYTRANNVVMQNAREHM